MLAGEEGIVSVVLVLLCDIVDAPFVVPSC